MNLGGKNVLVTGADGFIGSHLVEALIEEGARVRALVMYNSLNNWGWLDTFHPDKLQKIQVFQGDIRDGNCVREAVEGMDAVFHLAALIAIPYSYYAPESYVDTNVKGTLNILQACRNAKVKRLMVTSTSEVYGTAKYVPIDEKHPFQGQSPYSASKIGADRLAEAYYKSFDLPVTIVRPFNTYGPRQSARAVIPSIIIQLLSGKREIRMGNVLPTRDFNYVKDTAAGFLDIAQSEETIGEEINIATGREISVKDIFDEISRQICPDARIVTDDFRQRPLRSEVERLLGSNEKIGRLTGWRPKYSLETGLEETIAWLRSNLNRYKPDIYNI